MNKREKTNFWSYVIFAPHSFFALVIAGFVLGGLLFLIGITSQENRDFSEETVYSLALGASLFSAFTYWIPMAIKAYAHLQLANRMNTKLDRDIEAHQTSGVEPDGTGQPHLPASNSTTT